MRAIVVLILITLCGAAFADSNGERSSQAGDRTPNATAVISGLYAFGRFQQGLLESADLKGNQEVRSLATLRAEDAAKRDKTLKQIQEAIGVEPSPLKAPTAGPDDSEGPAYVRQFYAVQVGEYQETIDLLERYLRAPDNEALSAFARAQLPLLRSQLSDTARSMADK
jgi:hypothetical protein